MKQQVIKSQYATPNYRKYAKNVKMILCYIKIKTPKPLSDIAVTSDGLNVSRMLSSPHRCLESIL